MVETTNGVQSFKGIAGTSSLRSPLKWLHFSGGNCYVEGMGESEMYPGATGKGARTYTLIIGLVWFPCTIGVVRM